MALETVVALRADDGRLFYGKDAKVAAEEYQAQLDKGLNKTHMYMRMLSALGIDPTTPEETDTQRNNLVAVMEDVTGHAVSDEYHMLSIINELCSAFPGVIHTLLELHMEHKGWMYAEGSLVWDWETGDIEGLDEEEVA